MILMKKEKLSEGGKAMLSKIAYSVEIDEKDMEYFGKSFCRSKVLNPMKESEQQVYLKWIEMLVKKRVDGIMEGNFRRYYFECAEYIAALGEVRESRGVLNGKQQLMLEYKTELFQKMCFS